MRTRLSTTVHAELLESAGKLRLVRIDAALVDEALRALLMRHRSAQVDASYAAYDQHPQESSAAARPPPQSRQAVAQ